MLEDDNTDIIDVIDTSLPVINLTAVRVTPGCFSHSPCIGKCPSRSSGPPKNSYDEMAACGVKAGVSNARVS